MQERELIVSAGQAARGMRSRSVASRAAAKVVLLVVAAIGAPGCAVLGSPTPERSRVIVAAESGRAVRLATSGAATSWALVLDAGVVVASRISRPEASMQEFRRRDAALGK